MKNRILILIALIPFCHHFSFGQVNQFQWNNTNSDYFANIDWSVNTNTSCDCAPYPNMVFNFKHGGTNDIIHFEQGQINNPWTVSTDVPIGPNQSINMFGQLFNALAKLSFIGSCDQPCGVGYTSNTILVTTQPLKAVENLAIMRTDTGSAVLTWNNVTDIPESTHFIKIFKNGVYLLNYSNDKSLESWEDPCPNIGDVYKIQTIYDDNGNLTITNAEVTYTQQTANANRPLGKILGKVETEATGSPVKDVAMLLELTNPQDLTNGDCWPTVYHDTTDVNGEYNFSFLYYGDPVTDEVAKYKVTPSLINHDFDPGEIILELDAGNKTRTQNFLDTTSFVVTGMIRDITGCGINSALVSRDGVDFTYSDENGEYLFVVPETGTYQISAMLDTNDLGTINVLVEDNVQDQDFDYLLTDTISLYVGAGCNEFIGQSMIDIRTSGGCLIETEETNLSGYINDLIVPLRPLILEVTSFAPPSGSDLDPLVVLNDIGGEKDIVVDSTSLFKVIYRKPLSLQIEGMPGPPCPAVSLPVLEQIQPYTIQILVWESPDICRADTGAVYIQDNIAASGLQSAVLDTVPIINGVATYTIIPGEPVLNAPYTKNISITAVVDSQIVNSTVEAIVSGSRQRTQTFLTGAPTELPYLILRDPPGDESYSFFNESETTTYTESFSNQIGGDIRLWAKVNVKAGVFINTLGEIGGGITVGASRRYTDETTTVLEHNTSIQTSSEQDKIGGDFDLVYGAAVNFIYGLADERIFDVNTCSVIADTVLVFSPDTFETTFIKSIKDIREVTLPALELAANNPDTTEEARRRFANEISKWEQVLQSNEDLKAEALKNPLENYTISGNAGPVSLSTTASTTQTTTIEFQQFLNVDIAASAGISIGDDNFVGQGGVEVNIRGEWGQSFRDEITESTTTGFVFDDTGEINDEVSFDYAVDPVYSTPVFGKPIGKTSCPHEMYTQLIDNPRLMVLNPVQYAEAGTDVLTYEFLLSNYSESNQTRTYLLDFIETDGSVAVKFGGAPLPPNGQSFTLAAGQDQLVLIQVEMISGIDQYAFEGLEFQLKSECEPSLFSNAFISAFFENDCPFVSMPMPANGFLINENSNNLMGVVMDDYILNPDIDHIRLMYKRNGENWEESNINVPGPNIQVPPINSIWDVTDLQDGEYAIRWELKCGSTINTSPRKSGIIDRKAPRVFGNEKPTNDLYQPGDEISVTFNEFIDILALQNGNFYVQNTTAGVSVPATITSDDKKIIVDLGIATDSTMFNHEFEIGLINVTDVYGNMRPDTVVWQFVVSEPDSDRDGIRDLSDRCPGGDDCEDSDQDGIPDDCDCLPNIPQNGRFQGKAAMNFDGVDDHFIVSNAAAIIPTSTKSVTYEAWIHPTESTNEFGMIFASGSFPNQNHHVYYYNSTGRIWVTGNGVGPLISLSSVPKNEWTHVAIVFDQTVRKIYINGVLDREIVQTLNSNNLGFDLGIGNQPNVVPGWNFTGHMDEVRIWNNARTETQINENMRKEQSNQTSQLLRYYNFNNGIPLGDNLDLNIVKNGTGAFNSDGQLNNFNQSGLNSNWIYQPANLLTNAKLELCKNCPDAMNAAMDFDGVNDYLDIANNSTLVPTFVLDNRTIEFWINPIDSSATANDLLIDMGNNLKITRKKNFIELNSVSTELIPVAIPAKQWSHVSMVFTAFNLKLYLNGILEYEGFPILEDFNLGSPIYIGGSPDPSLENLFDGKIDDLRFWDYGRSEQQITDNMFTEMVGDESGLAAYYNFNEGQIAGNNTGRTFAEDATGNGNDATFHEMLLDGGYSNYVESPFDIRIDEDEDGLPDACDDCIPTNIVNLSNQTLSGTYIAKDKIILGSGLSIMDFDTVNLRAPNIQVLDNISIGDSTRIYVRDKPCDE